MTVNTNPASGIVYGYISANALDSDLVNALQIDGKDVYYEEAWKEFITLQEFSEPVTDADREVYRQEFDDDYEGVDEPIHEGTYEGVKYRTSWLGGALNVWIFESPHITHLARRASPCVSNAGILDTLDGNVTSYDVPPEWRAA